MTKKQMLVLFLNLFLLVMGSSTTVFAATVSDKAMVAPYPITMNGEVINSDYAKYPLLQYKHIIYLPITQYQDFLGISYVWNEPTKSYYIKKDSILSTQLVLETQKKKSNTSCVVKILDTSVHILDFPENISFQNRKADYPVLEFRNTLYFPLTWQYAHNVFGWDYQWDRQTGLKIDSRDAIRPELNMHYPGDEVVLRSLSHPFQCTYFSDGYAKYYKNKEDPVFCLQIKIKGLPEAGFGEKFKDRFLPDLEEYVMPGKINQFWSAPNQKIDNPQVDITHQGNLVFVPFVYLKDDEHKADVQNCIVTVDVKKQEIVNVQEITVAQALQYPQSVY